MGSRAIFKVVSLLIAIRAIVGLMIFVLFSCCSKNTHPLIQYADGNLQVFEKGIISTDANHEGISFISKDYDEIIFTRSSKGFKTSQLLYSKFKNGIWSTPKAISMTDSNYEAGIAFSPDMEKAFFTNKAPIKNKAFNDEWNIWQVDVASTQDYKKNSVRPVEVPVNSDSMDCCVTMNSNGTTLFSSNRDGTWDIYKATYKNGGFENIKKLSGAINSNIYDEWPSFINDEENIVFYSSIRKDGFGGDDLYYSKYDNGKWSKAELFDDKFNSSSYEDGAFITKDGEYLFFSSWKPTSFSKEVSNIYIKRIDNEFNKSVAID